jgi:hypothetical protein
VGGEIPPAVGDFPVGSRIAGYQIEQLIGRGGMASVYRATDVRLDRVVALKVLTPQLAEDDAFRQRFIRESRSGAAVDHPNVIPVFEAGEASGVLFIAMRYVVGRDVRALLDREGRLTTGRAVNIVTQVASALDAAHAHGLIHRDVKPANMLLATVASPGTPDHVYLSDFGLSKLSVSELGSLTGTGQFLGTLDYMSPEQIEGRPIDGRTDLYALGCAAFEMLTGEPPFRREANLAVMWAQVAAPPPSVRDRRPDLPADVDQVLARALAKSPDDRQASCLEFAAQLRAACAIRSAAAPAPVPQQPLPPPTELALGPVAGAGPAASAGPAGGAGPVLPPVSAPVGFEATVTEAAIGGVAAPSGSAGGFGGTGYADARYAGAGAQLADAGYGGGGAQFRDAGYGGAQFGGATGGPPSAAPDQTHQLWQGSGGYPPAGQPAGPPPRRRGKALPVFLGLVAVAILAGAAFVVLHLHAKGQAGPKPTVTITRTHHASPSSGPSTSPSPSSSATSPSPSTSPSGTAGASPQAVVQQYYTDINDHDYRGAYAINQHVHPTQTYAEFKAGYASTQSVTLTIVSASGDTVNVRFTSTHTDGTVYNYSGTYTVQNGQIVDSLIQNA